MPRVMFAAFYESTYNLGLKLKTTWGKNDEGLLICIYT